MAKKRTEILWLPEHEDDHYPAASSYLELSFDPTIARALVKALRKAPVSRFMSKDIFRASGLSLLGISNSQVEKNLKKIVAGKPLAPVLLVRDSARGRVIIADGYHRVCAVYSVDEDALIPCKIVTL